MKITEIGRDGVGWVKCGLGYDKCQDLAKMAVSLLGI